MFLPPSYFKNLHFKPTWILKSGPKDSPLVLSEGEFFIHCRSKYFVMHFSKHHHRI